QTTTAITRTTQMARNPLMLQSSQELQYHGSSCFRISSLSYSALVPASLRRGGNAKPSSTIGQRRRRTPRAATRLIPARIRQVAEAVSRGVVRPPDTEEQ